MPGLKKVEKDPYYLALEIQEKIAKNLKFDSSELNEDNVTHENSNQFDDFIIQSQGSISPTSGSFALHDLTNYSNNVQISDEALKLKRMVQEINERYDNWNR